MWLWIPALVVAMVVVALGLRRRGSEHDLEASIAERIGLGEPRRRRATDLDARVEALRIQVFEREDGATALQAALQADCPAAAIALLERVEGAGVAPTLLAALDGLSGAAAVHVITALGRAGAEAAQPALIDRLTDPDGGVRATAVCALERVGTPEAIESLLKAALEPPLHADAIRSVTTIRRRFGGASAGAVSLDDSPGDLSLADEPGRLSPPDE